MLPPLAIGSRRQSSKIHAGTSLPIGRFFVRIAIPTFKRFTLFSTRWSGLIVLVIFISATGAAALASDEAAKPDLRLFELGVAGAFVDVPDYPGASQNHAKYLPAPYLIYRGDILRSDREGTRARLLRSPYADIDLSGAGSFASKSNDDDARRGMPDLDYLLEVGPRLTVPLSDLQGRGKLSFLVPVRAVFSTNLSNLHDRGFTLTPAVFARVNSFFRPQWIGISQLSGNFASRQLMSYFYDVAPAYVTPTRAFYNARAGYLGTDWFNGLVIPVGRRLHLIMGVQLWDLTGAANQSSPLFRRDISWTTLVGASYAFYVSNRPAKARIQKSEF